MYLDTYLPFSEHLVEDNSRVQSQRSSRVQCVKVSLLSCYLPKVDKLLSPSAVFHCRMGLGRLSVFGRVPPSGKTFPSFSVTDRAWYTLENVLGLRSFQIDLLNRGLYLLLIYVYGVEGCGGIHLRFPFWFSLVKNLVSIVVRPHSRHTYPLILLSVDDPN